jgi:MoaA/NifB/PqqE/SkfB family radical SAM enzyme
MFELTYSCNFRCKHCYVPDSYRQKYKVKELKTKEIFSILEQLKSMGCFYLGFTGGEPFLRKDIMEVLQYAKGCGFEVIIYTNGSLVDEPLAEKLAYLGLNKVDITIPAISKAAFKRITGVNLRDRVFKGVELLHKKGVKLGFKTCILKENEAEIKKIGKFTASFGGMHRWDDLLSCRLDGSREPYRYRSIAMRTRLNKLKLKEEDSYECGFKGTGSQSMNKDLFTCGAGLRQAAITPAGELKMCLLIDYPKYKILGTSLAKCWQELRDLKESIQYDKNYLCDKCGLKVYCNWCPAKAWAHNKTFVACDPESRLLAKARRAAV